ncbi:alanine racemase C-terminal domain-containing protein, partial [Pseudomonas aeruginosa]|uniref:alanine racemase C-terminal domain-containing protein n=2 Tax=Bacteria TaxID=2 RepID=UPI0035254D2A
IEVRGGIAVLGVGALDGLPSTLGGRTVARSPAGLVAVRSVDDLTTSVDAWPHAAVGETVRIYGVGAPSATDLAEAIDTIGEEIAVRLSP